MTEVLVRATPRAWVDEACRRWQELLVDHAACEKKAASSALALLFAYPEDGERNVALARLAREELRHFEQVERLMRRLQVAPRRQRPGRYAAELRRALRAREPDRQLDLLLCGALIEARSCERFALLVPRIAPELAELYLQLEQSESRHFATYLGFARRHAEDQGINGWMSRLQQLALIEADLATRPDDEFRFHSGPPASAR